MARWLDFDSANFAADFDALLDSKRESDSGVHDAVASIIADIRNHGDPALLALTAKFDNLHAKTAANLAVGQNEMMAALNGLDADLRAALELAADRIRSFHEKQLPQDFAYEDDAGVETDFTPLFIGLGGNLTVLEFVFAEGHVGMVGEGLGFRGFAGVSLERVMKKALNLPVNLLIGSEAFVSSDMAGGGNPSGWAALGVRLDYSF